MAAFFEKKVTLYDVQKRRHSSLQMIWANVGDAKSLVIHPASTTHHRMDAVSLEKAGISEGTIRLSVGLEDHEDLINDLDLGFRAAKKIL